MDKKECLETGGISSQRTLFSLSMPRTIALLLHYFICYGWLYRMAGSFITLSIDPYATMILPWVQWIIYTLTVIVSAVLAWPALCHSLRRFKDHVNRNISLIALLTIVLVIVNMALSMAVSFFTKTNGSNNQEIIREASSAIPFITIIATTVVAPFVEECVFRCGAFTFLRRRGGFIMSAVVSSLLFASIHFFDSIMSGNFADFSYLIVYTGLGLVLAYGYEKSESAAVPFAIHLINNALSMLVMFI